MSELKEPTEISIIPVQGGFVITTDYGRHSQVVSDHASLGGVKIDGRGGWTVTLHREQLPEVSRG